MDKLLEFFLYLQGPYAYLAAFLVLLACGLGVPIPEDITLFTMGILSYYGLADLWISIAVCLFGVLFGDSLIYFIGRKYGTRLTQKGIFKRLLPPDRLEKTREMFRKRGNSVIFMARFMPGLRAPTYFSAGVLHLPFRVFFLYDGLASLISVPALVSVTYIFGDQVHDVIQVARKVQHGIVFLILFVVLLIVIKYLLRRREKKRAQSQ